MAPAWLFWGLLAAAGPDDATERDLPWARPPAEAPTAQAASSSPGEARKLSRRPRREPEDWALLVPRMILTVPRVVLTGVVAPLSAILSVFDGGALARIRRAFLWNREETIGWRPAFAFQGGYGFSIGAKIFHEDLLGHDEELEAEALAGGLYFQAYQLRLHGDRIGGSPVWLDARGRYDVTPRLIFQGVGNPPAAPVGSEGLGPREAAVRTRYSQARGLFAVRGGWGLRSPGRVVRPGLGVAFSHRELGREHRRRELLLGPDDRVDPSVEDVYDVDRLVGFREGVDVVRLGAQIEIDSRNHPGRPSRGLHLFATGGGAPPQLRGVAFGHYGAELTAYANLLHDSRILVARVGLEAVHGSDARIPFTELPRLGGPLRLRGYRLGRFRDKRAVLGTIEYRFPIHEWIEGHLFVDAGRVARTWRELGSGDPRPWHAGYGGGFTLRTLERFWFRVDLSYGDDFLVFFSTDPLQAFADRHVLEL